MRRHINNCHGTSPRVQCPYCNKTRSRQDDLIRHHIVNHHPQKVAEVQRNPGLIKTVTEEEPKKKKTRDQEHNKKEEVTRQENTSAATSLIGRPISPITDDGKNSRATPDLFRRLDAMIADTGADNTETPPKKKPKLSEVQQAVASITCNADTPSIEISATDPYIPSCTNASTQTDQVETDEVDTQTEVNMKVSMETQAAAQMVDRAVDASVAIMKSMSCQADCPIPSGRKGRKDAGFRENHCRHGVRKPVHVHIKKEVISPSGEVTKTEEIQVNCARCPPPAVVVLAKVPREALPHSSKRGDSTSGSSSSSSSSDSE